MVAAEATEEIRDMIREMLQERFESDFEFDPIVVIPRVDRDGEEYLQSYIVFHGDQERLDPLWTLRLSNSLWSRARELGFPGIPIPMFVERSEWPDMEKSLA